MNDTKVWELDGIKKQITKLNKDVKKLEHDRDTLAIDIIDELTNSGLSMARTLEAKEGQRITVSINPEDVANVVDWAEFEEYIYDNRALYLLQRRASNPAYRDELKIRDTIPGVETFTKQKLGLTHVSI